VAITREILRVKLKGQAEVARLIRSADASAEIDRLSAALARETDGSKVLSIEAHAASIYWKLWKDVPVRFARRSPQRLGPNGRWRAGRTDLWLTFGQRASLLTKSPHRATTPGNALLNYLYALLASEMTVALLAVGLDPGIGMFHADFDGRSSLALDAIEAARPHVDYWLLGFLEASTFANRDFPELDGEVARHIRSIRISRTPRRLVAHAGADRRVAQSFFRGRPRAVRRRRRRIHAPHTIPPNPLNRAEARSSDTTLAGIHWPGLRLSADAGAGRV
jgi:CRISPR-associated endonuclease Cas1